MAPKREREEDEHPVAERSGAGIEEAAGGHVLTIEAMMERINDLQEMIVVKETAHEMEGKFTSKPSSFLYSRAQTLHSNHRDENLLDWPLPAPDGCGLGVVMASFSLS